MKTKPTKKRALTKAQTRPLSYRVYWQNDPKDARPCRSCGGTAGPTACPKCMGTLMDNPFIRSKNLAVFQKSESLTTTDLGDFGIEIAPSALALRYREGPVDLQVSDLLVDWQQRVWKVLEIKEARTLGVNGVSYDTRVVGRALCAWELDGGPRFRF